MNKKPKESLIKPGSVTWWAQELGCSRSHADRVLRAFREEYEWEPDPTDDHVDFVYEFAQNRAMHSNRWWDSPFREQTAAVSVADNPELDALLSKLPEELDRLSDSE